MLCGTGCITRCGSRSPSPARWSLAAASSVEQHVHVLTANQLDNHFGHGPADEQIGRQDA
jgi:hypothetical protein